MGGYGLHDAVSCGYWGGSGGVAGSEGGSRRRQVVGGCGGSKEPRVPGSSSRRSERQKLGRTGRRRWDYGWLFAGGGHASAERVLPSLVGPQTAAFRGSLTHILVAGFGLAGTLALLLVLRPLAFVAIPLRAGQLAVAMPARIGSSCCAAELLGPLCTAHRHRNLYKTWPHKT